MSPPFYVWHKKSDFPAKILIATWCNHIGISCSIIFISDIECFFMSERVYQLDFTIKYNFKHVYLICCNFIFGGKIRFFMSDVEWRWQVGKSFFFQKSISVFRVSNPNLDISFGCSLYHITSSSTSHASVIHVVYWTSKFIKLSLIYFALVWSTIKLKNVIATLLFSLLAKTFWLK